MLDRLILHIGMGKTGSSSIQEFLDRNLPVLRKDGFAAYGPNDIDPCPQKNLSDTPRFLAAIEELTRRLEEARATSLIWSLEGFATRQFLSDPARLEAIRTYLPASDVRAVIYLRRQDDFAVSAHLQWNVVNKSYHGPVRSFEERFPSVYGEPDGTPLEQTNLNYYGLIRRWADFVGPSNIRVRPLETGQLVDGDLIKDFIDAAGLPPRTYDCDIPRVNRTFHRELTDLMGLYGSVFEGPVGAAELIFFFRSFGHDQIFDEPTFTKFQLPPATRVQILQDCAAINEQIARDFLGRSDGVLFREPWPSSDDPYTPYTGLTQEKVIPILLHILKKQHMQINFLMNERRRMQEPYTWARVKKALARRIGSRIAERLR